VPRPGRIALSIPDAPVTRLSRWSSSVRDHAQILIGSEEVEPGAGWPYDTIVRDLVAPRPAMPARALAATIVRRYAESYRQSGMDVTKSAVERSKLEPLVEAMDRLAGALAPGALPAAPAPSELSTDYAACE
jgi:hypothetical protein